MADASPHHGSPQSSGNSHLVALLSLKILLLAFFLLLNSLATFQEERSSAVVESVRDAFQGLLPAERSVNRDPSGLAMLDGGEDVVDALKQLFGSDLPLADLPASSGGRVLQIDFADDSLFEGDGSALGPEGVDTLRQLAAVLSDSRFIHQRVRIDVLYGLPGSSSGLADHRVALLRAAAVVRLLEGEGVPAMRLSAGLLPNFPTKVRLHFTVDAASVDAASAAPAGGEGSR